MRGMLDGTCLPGALTDILQSGMGPEDEYAQLNGNLDDGVDAEESEETSRLWVLPQQKGTKMTKTELLRERWSWHR